MPIRSSFFLHNLAIFAIGACAMLGTACAPGHIDWGDDDDLLRTAMFRLDADVAVPKMTVIPLERRVPLHHLG